MSNNENEIENPNKIQDTVKKILKFNKQNQTRRGLTRWAPNQILSRFPITTTDTIRWIDVDSMSILRGYVKKKISINFHVFSTYFFDVISMGEKSALFRRTFSDVISMSKNSTLLWWEEDRCHFHVHFSKKFWLTIDQYLFNELLPCDFDGLKSDPALTCVFER